MVFNSWEFIFLFLPVAYVAFLVAHRVGGWRLAYSAIAVASWIFYAQWSLTLLAILLGSVVVNYALGNMLISAAERSRPSGPLLVLGVCANLATLGYFKYTNFFIDVVNQAGGSGLGHLDIILPVGISFYTFIQIGYLVEAHSGHVQRPTFSKYALFATFFPCVTAGPLVLQREIFDQVGDRKDQAFDPKRLSVGLTLFAMGLFKKVVLADTIAPYADVAFDGVAAGSAIDMTVAWVGSLSYALQLYFDFSGYSDMAMGLGLVFGIRLPVNFNSPFKATSISDFWRRWHMTMTRFFTTYIFTPMSMQAMRKAVEGRHGRSRKFLMTAAWPMAFTFLIAGIWHGAGWTFVVYGAIHGVALAINHAWREFRMPSLPPVVGWVLTMTVVLNGLVVFRADSLETAGTILASMWGVALLVPQTAAEFVVIPDLQVAVGLIIMLGEIVLLVPNTLQILKWEQARPEAPAVPTDNPIADIAWRPTPAWAAVTAAGFAIAITLMGANSSFLYYQF